MARSVNKVTLIGNVGQDPEVRFMPSGNAVASLSLATTDSWTDKQSGQKQERTEWHKVVIFGKIAEIVQQYVKKGSKLYVEGRLQTRKWQGQDGQDRYTTEIVVDINGQILILDGRQDGGQQGQGGGQQQQQQRQQPQGGQGQQQQQQRQQSAPQGGQQQGNYGAPDPGSFDDFDDEIPF